MYIYIYTLYRERYKNSMTVNRGWRLFKKQYFWHENVVLYFQK